MINIDTKRKTNFAVTLTPCYFREHTYIARVPRKMITTDQILDLVAAHNQGIDFIFFPEISNRLNKIFEDIIAFRNDIYLWFKNKIFQDYSFKNKND